MCCSRISTADEAEGTVCVQVRHRFSRSKACKLGFPQVWHCQEPAGVLTICQLSAGGYLGAAAQRSS